MVEKRVTAQRVVTHLRENGTYARVLYVIPDDNTLKNNETGPIIGKQGLMTLYGDELSGNPNKGQLTHSSGGVVSIITTYNAAKNVMKGIRYSMIVFENLSGQDAQVSSIKGDLMTQLTIEPRVAIESKDAFYDAA